MTDDKKTDVWMPIWIGAYTADTMDLTTLQHGAYLLLLLNYWRKRCALPDNDDVLRSITKLERAEWKRNRAVLAGFFQVGNGVWWHKRVEAEMVEADKRAAAASAKAKAGANARWKDKAKERPSNARSDASANAPANAPSMPQALLEGVPEQCPPPTPSIPSGYSDAVASGGTPPATSGRTEVPPSPLSKKDIVFALGVPLLTAAGVAEKNSRSFLAMQCKQHGDSDVAEALRQCAEAKAIEPVSWIQNFLGTKRHAASKHSGFESKNYREGIEDDGSFVA